MWEAAVAGASRGAAFDQKSSQSFTADITVVIAADELSPTYLQAQTRRQRNNVKKVVLCVFVFEEDCLLITKSQGVAASTAVLWG